MKSKMRMKNPIRLNKLNRKKLYLNIGYAALIIFFIYICYKTYKSQKMIIEGLTAQEKNAHQTDIKNCSKNCKGEIKECIKECDGDKDCKADCKSEEKEMMSDCNDACIETCEENCPTDPDLCDDGKDG